MGIYSSTGALKVTVNDTQSKGAYAADGSARVTVVPGTTYTGLYAADGSMNVVAEDGPLYHPCGAIRGKAALATYTGLSSPSGAMYMDGLTFVPFDPTQLFAAAEAGLFYDVSDFDRYTATNGPELVTNGTFDTDIAGWTDASSAGGSISWNPSGYMDLVYTTGAPIARQQVNVTGGRWYRFSISNVQATTAGGVVQFYIGSTSNGSDLIGLTSVSVGASSTVTFLATSSAAHITLRNVNTGTVSADNISILELTDIETATMFQDMDGSIPVTGVEQPVGLILDRSRGAANFGSELVTDGEFESPSSWTTINGANVTGGLLNLPAGAAAASASQPISVSFGKYYQVTITVVRRAGAIAASFIGGPTTSNFFTVTASGTYTFRVTPNSGNNTLQLTGTTAAADGDITNISIREVTRTILGPELLTNGTFYTNTTGWTAVSSTLAVVSGELEVTAATTNYPRAEQVYPLVVGKTYRMIATARKGTANADAYISYTSGPYVSTTSTTNVTLTMVFTATNVNGLATLGIFSGTATGTAYFDNVSVREIIGTDAYQSTASSRPTLSAKYNFLVYTQQFDNAVWTKSGLTVNTTKVVAPDGTITAQTLDWASGTSPQITRANILIAVNSPLVYSLSAKAGTKSSVTLILYMDASNYTQCSFDLATGTPGTPITLGTRFPTVVPTMVMQSNGFYRCFLTVTTNVNTTIQPWIRGDTLAATGDNIIIWGADLRPSNDGVGLPSYQAVVTASDYTTTGFPKYLRFDQVDDFLITPTLDFSSTNKVTMFTGVRKLIEASSCIAELSQTFTSNNGSFGLLGSSNLTGILGDYYRFGSRGTTPGTSTGYQALASGSAAPISSVIVATGDIASNLATINVNNTDGTPGVGSQGTGTLLAYPMYIGARAGNTLRYNGRIYNLIVLGRLATANEIANTKTWINSKVKVY